MSNKFLLALLVCLFWSSSSEARKSVVHPPIAPGWQRLAEDYLFVYRENRRFNSAIDKEGLRCVRMNNYGCLWQPEENWEGTPGPDGTDGAHDGEGGNNGHAIFSHPKWSIVASLRWFEVRTSGGAQQKSALQLAAKYAPWCDTLGSKGTKPDASGRLWGRGCAGGNRPPPGFAGPICAEPSSGKPSKAQCQACNCPNSIARFWLKENSASPSDPLVLFDDTGKPTVALQNLIKWKIGLETGRYQPTQSLLDEAVRVFEPKR